MRASFVRFIFLISAIGPLVTTSDDSLNELDLFGGDTVWTVNNQVPELLNEPSPGLLTEADSGLLNWATETDASTEQLHPDNISDDALLATSSSIDSSDLDLFAAAPPDDFDCSLTPSQSSLSSPPSRQRARAEPEICRAHSDESNILELNPAMEEAQKKWCSKTSFPWFQNIPVCRIRIVDMFGYGEDLDDVENAYFPNTPEEGSITVAQGYIGMF